MKIWILLWFLLFSLTGQSQKLKNEVEFVEDFHRAMDNMKAKLMKEGELTVRQKRILRRTRYSIDSLTNSFDVYSNSSSRVITYNETAWLSILRCVLAEELSRSSTSRSLDPMLDYLEEDEIKYDRMNFSGFYNAFLKWLPATINFIDEAELSPRQKEAFIEGGMFSESVKWKIKKIIFFIYLHEFYHQVQGINKKKSKIEKISNENTRKELLLGLEKQCDSFAVYKAAKLRIMPEGYLDVFEVIESFRFNKAVSVSDILKRKKYFLEMRLRLDKSGYEPELPPGDEDNSREHIEFINSKLADRTSLSVSQFEQAAIQEGDIEKIFSLGMLHLTGNDAIDVKNVEKALAYFERAKDMLPYDDEQYVAKERCLLYAAKIHQLVYKDSKKARPLMAEAAKIAVFFPKDFYDNAILRLEK